MFFKRRQQNQRRHPRKEYGTSVTITCEEQTYRCVLQDISKGGAFLRIEQGHPIRQGAFIDLSIPYTGRNEYVQKMGKVTRVDSQGVGVRFIT
jgi:c-di-GMP-binding flagellar brake protein YcgR